MQALIQNLLMFLIFILVGYILQVKSKVTPQLQYDLSYLLMKVTMPCMLFAAIAQPFDQSLMREGIAAFGFMLVCFLIGFIVGLISLNLFKVKKSQHGVWLLGTTFSNLGFMGFPIINAVLGSDGLFIASFANIAFNIVFFTAGILIIMGKDEKHTFNWKEVFLNNIMLSISLGLFFFFTRIEISPFIKNTVQTLGSITTPLAMLVIGLKLGEFPLREVFNNRKQYQLCIMRLVIVPTIIVFLFKLLPVDEKSLLISVLIILNAMPIPANSIIVANQYGGDAAFIAKATTLSSILCLITIPIILFIV